MTDARPPARYRRIAADLADRIRTGDYPAGYALPGQRELSARYGVSLMTLRQALQELRDEGLIVQEAGRGTYVAAAPAYRLDTLRSLADDLREQGHDVTTEVLGVALRKPPEQVARQLEMRGGDDRGLRLERLRLLSGRPAVHQVSWVPPPHAAALRDHDFTEASLYGSLAEVGVIVATATETVRPALLSPAAARRLSQSPGEPVFISDRITIAANGSVVVDRATILGNLLEIRAERATNGLSVRFATRR